MLHNSAVVGAGVVENEGKVEILEQKEQMEPPFKEGLITLPEETLDFFGGDEIRARVFYEKYALKDDSGRIVEKVPSEMWTRVAREIASVEDPAKRAEWEEKFKWLLQDFRFLPGGRIMFGAGQGRKSTLLNCYVISIKEDSIEAIFDWCKEAARTYSYGGGVGTDISILRPKGSPVNNSAVHSTGSTSFMNIFSETTHTIGQSGRRGALMITISVDHPDIINFINVKKDLQSVRYANISVRITDEFMEAVEKDTDFTLRYNNKVIGEYDRKVRARDVWNLLVQSARDWAEPGLIFWDQMKRYSPSEYNGMEVVGTNPCSEQPLQNYGACDLGNINLSTFVVGAFTEKAALDWSALEKTVRYAVRFLDDVLDYNDGKHPLKQQAEAARSSRRIGVGVTGFGDMLTELMIKYDSDKALAFTDDLFNKIKHIAYDESIEIAREKGSFPLFDREKHLSMPFIKTLAPETQQKIRAHGLRNVAILTVPPVGSGSVLAGTSSGIEPIFAFSYTRRSESLSQSMFKVYHPLALDYMKIADLKDDSQLPDFFIPAHKIKAEFRVKMQGVIQRHVDSAISSTVNLPRETTAEQVGQIYMQAWKSGCKGITVYREGSRQGILITDEAQKQQEGQAAQAAQKAPSEWKRPRMLVGKTIKLRLPQGSLYITTNLDEENKPREVFVTMGRAGSQEKSYCDALGRMISKYLQFGGDAADVISSIKGIKANDSITWDHGLKLYSIPDAIAKALEIVTGAVTPLYTTGLAKGPAPAEGAMSVGQQMPIAEATAASPGSPKVEICVSCGENSVVHENGCYVCKMCGYTKCD